MTETERREAVRLFRALEPERQLELSLQWEHDTGYDSIPTIQTHYEYGCVFPGCKVQHKNKPEEMWIHVHLSRKHPNDPVIMKNLYARIMRAHGLEVDDND